MLFCITTTYTQKALAPWPRIQTPIVETRSNR